MKEKLFMMGFKEKIENKKSHGESSGIMLSLKNETIFFVMFRKE